MDVKFKSKKLDLDLLSEEDSTITRSFNSLVYVMQRD